jgi:hypothetical protein
MTEPENPPKQNRGFSGSLESAKKQRRAFHIPTAPAPAVRLVQNLNLKGASLHHPSRLFSRLILRLEKTLSQTAIALIINEQRFTFCDLFPNPAPAAGNKGSASL